MQIVSVPVLEMSCASCAVSVESILKAEKGVVSVVVNYANAQARIEFDDSITSLETLKKKVQAVGYDLYIEPSNEAIHSLDIIKINALKKLQYKTIGSLILSVPLIVLGMFFMHAKYTPFLLALLSTPIVFYFGNSFFIHAFKQAKHRQVSMDTLVALSTGIAYLYSLFVLFFPHLLFKHTTHLPVYFESAGVVIAFVLLGKYLEAKAKQGTNKALTQLMGLKPNAVTIRIDNQLKVIPIDTVLEEDVLMAHPGERIAVDGIVIEGFSYVDESMLTGEPIPIEKSIGQPVFAGALNTSGTFYYRANKVGKDTLLAQIIKNVADAQASKAPVQKTVDKIAGIFVPVVVVIALLTFFAWLLLAKEEAFNHAIISSITVLIIACPCALGLATPTAIMVGVGKAAEKGILIKDAESIEAASRIDAVVLDKTGTITIGKPEVVKTLLSTSFQPIHHSILYTIESQSQHPLSNAIVQWVQKGPYELLSFTIEAIHGKGVQVSYKERVYLIGKPDWVTTTHQRGLSDEWTHWIEEAQQKGYTVVLFGNEMELLAAFALSDICKPTSKEAIKKLLNANIEVYMLSGDNQTTAMSIAREVGIQQVQANVLPSEKSIFIKKLQHQGKCVAMVGDGINDSEALAQANVSIAMGKGSDVAMEVAKITIISSDLLKISEVITISKNTIRTIHQNLFWAFIYNCIGIPLAAGVLYPFTGYTLDPMYAGAAMAFSSVSVVANSLWLSRKKMG
jgi:Cu2+-exporting ATPase